MCSAAQADPTRAHIDAHGWKETAPHHVALLTPLLRGQAHHWYRLSKRLEPAQVAPIFPALVRRVGAYEQRTSPLFLSGSDLIEAAIGLPKLAGLSSQWRGAAPSEINLVDTRSEAQCLASRQRDREAYRAFSNSTLLTPNLAEHEETLIVQARGRYIDLQVGAYHPPKPLPGRRLGLDEVIFVNGEGNWNLSTFIENTTAGRFLIAGAEHLAVPFKHGYLVRLDPDGQCHLLARTEQDARNYDDKLLTLPDEHRFPRDWHELTNLQRLRGQHPQQAALIYNLAVYARTKAAGWRFSARTDAILQTWARHAKSRANTTFFADIADAELHARLFGQGLFWYETNDMLKDFGLDTISRSLAAID